MTQQIRDSSTTYAPMRFKTFEGALGAFFSQECPQLGGERTRRMLVQTIMEMIQRFYPETHHLRPGQMVWTTVDKNEKASYGKSIQHTRLTPVVLDLVRFQDVLDRAQGKRLREIKKEAVARLFTQAYEQQGCLTNAELAVLLKISANTVGKYVREWEREHQRFLPRRGILHDLGPTVTHKKEIIRKLFFERKSVEQVQRETCHSPQAIHRYIQTFRQVLLCRQKGLDNQEIAFAVKISQRLVAEYRKLMDEMADRHRGFQELLELEIPERTR